MDIIVRGEPHELDFVRRLCRDKIARGVLAILPGNRPACDEVVRLRNERDETKAVITTLQEHVAALEKDRESMCNNQHELTDIAGMLVYIAVEGNAVIPEDLAARLSTYGIEIPAIEEPAINTGDATAEIVPDSNEPEPMDSKYIKVEDMQEADLGTDDKTPAADDTKDVQTDDDKETKRANKTSRRYKKSE